MASAISFGSSNSGLQVGVNNAPINHIQLPPERPETPPEPFSTVPFLRDPDFVDRGTLLKQVEEKCNIRPSRLALVGIGGVGKSQIALEYSYRALEKSRDTWVFWIHASNAARFEQSYRAIADQVKIPGHRDAGVNAVSLVTGWLNVEKRKWILILDNVDDDRFLHQQQLFSFLPSSSNGSIIMTTRSRAVALRFVEEHNLVEVSPMDSQGASSLMRAKLGAQSEPGTTSASEDEIMKLTKALEYMPLAIVQAAAYIKHPASRCSVAQYLENFQKSDSDKLELLDYEVGDIHRDMDAKNSILVTWQLSFEHIRQKQPSAADLLSLMSLFDRQGIPEAVLQKKKPRAQLEQFHEHVREQIEALPEVLPEKKTRNKIRNWYNSKRHRKKSPPRSPPVHEVHYIEDLQNSGIPDMTFDIQRDIMTLRDYSLVSISQDTKLFEMHRLVQLAMQKWLAANGEIEKWRTVFLEKLASEFIEADRNHNRPLCQSLFPHVKSAFLQRPSSKAALSTWAVLLRTASYFGYIYNDGAHLGDMAVESMKAEEELLGPSHGMNHHTAFVVALVYEAQGQWQKALDMQERMLEDMVQILGKRHDRTLTGMDDLAATYRRLGRYDESEALLKELLDIQKGKLGEDDLVIAKTMQSLAWTYYDQGRFSDAAKFAKDVVEMHKRVDGSEHSKTMAVARALLLVYSEANLLEEAEKFGHAALKKSRKDGGPDHPDMLHCMGYLMEVCHRRNKYREAEELGYLLLEATRKIHGPDHPETVKCEKDLSLIYNDTGQYEKAEILSRQALETQRKIWGNDHPESLRCAQDLYRILVLSRNYNEAEQLNRQVLEAYQQTYGPDHHDTLRCARDLSNIYYHRQQYEEAEDILRETLARLKKLGSVVKFAILRWTQDLASMLAATERDEEAEKIHRQVVETLEKDFGLDHPETTTAMKVFARFYEFIMEFEKAISLRSRIFEAARNKHGAEHPNTLRAMVDLALSLRAAGRDSEALEMILGCRDKQFRTLGADQPYSRQISRIIRDWQDEDSNDAVNSAEAKLSEIKSMIEHQTDA